MSDTTVNAVIASLPQLALDTTRCALAQARLGKKRKTRDIASIKTKGEKMFIKKIEIADVNEIRDVYKRIPESQFIDEPSKVPVILAVPFIPEVCEIILKKKVDWYSVEEVCSSLTTENSFVVFNMVGGRHTHLWLNFIKGKNRDLYIKKSYLKKFNGFVEFNYVWYRVDKTDQELKSLIMTFNKSHVYEFVKRPHEMNDIKLIKSGFIRACACSGGDFQGYPAQDFENYLNEKKIAFSKVSLDDVFSN